MKYILLFFVLLYFFVDAKGQQEREQHPEFGILPFNSPCTSCIEKMEKRTANTREFYSNNSDGSKSIFIQKSPGNINIKDKEGFWRAKDPRLVKESENIYAARMQPNPVVIDFQQKFASISSGNKEFNFNKNISLVHIAADGTETPFGTGDWSRMTRTENFAETIFLIEDFYPGVNLQMIANAGRMKTNFILKNKLPLHEGWLALRQELVLPAGYTTDLSFSSPVNESMQAGILNIVNESGQQQFTFNRSHAYDSKERTENFMEMPFRLNADVLDYNVPVDWLENPATVYPVTLDPIVIASDSIAQSNMLGSGYTTTQATGGCIYYIDSLMTPANCEVSEISTFFSYTSNLPCITEDGSFEITMFNPNGDSCVSRNFMCHISSGDCFFWPALLINNVPSLSPCLLPPQCTSYPLTFKMMFRRLNWIPFPPCDNTCIVTNSDWIINIEGRTSEITNQSSVQMICDSACATLDVTYDWGVPPHTVTWIPGGFTGDQVTVCPDSSTQYFAIVSDACGNTDTTFAIDVVVMNCTDVEEVVDPVAGIVPNPAKDYIKITFSPLMKNKSVEITNEIGEIVFEKHDIEENELELNVSNFSKGIYLLKASSGKHSGTHKIIIL
jgi:hypothetical protein